MREAVTVIYENDDVLVINKPAGLIVHSDGRTEEPTVVEWVLDAHPGLASVGDPWTSPQGEVIPRPGIVHRLDRTTSGIMILAKTQAAYAHLKNAFQSRAIQKEYLAYVYGHPKDGHGVIEAEIRRTRSTPPRWTAEPGKLKKRNAITEWKVLKRGVDSVTKDPVSLMSVSPKTGRTHQIRVHLKFLGYPVVSDHLYATGRNPLLKFTRPALHAFRITAPLLDGAFQTFEAPLPEDFKTAEKLFV